MKFLEEINRLLARADVSGVSDCNFPLFDKAHDTLLGQASPQIKVLLGQMYAIAQKMEDYATCLDGETNKASPRVLSWQREMTVLRARYNLLQCMFASAVLEDFPGTTGGMMICVCRGWHIVRSDKKPGSNLGGATTTTIIIKSENSSPPNGS